NGDPKAEKALMTQFASLPQSGDSSFSVGSDVSRFQRSTVPGKGQDSAAPAGAPSAAPVLGPVVNVARGNAVTAVPVGGKN
ncbi:MAG: Flp pilus assembly protein CpaB, partial [Sphingomonadales bacterium]|nr:Flp pilus assembly protein CpaB [Sphingomonadales bacterium]